MQRMALLDLLFDPLVDVVEVDVDLTGGRNYGL
jgi:hypothetical protein